MQHQQSPGLESISWDDIQLLASVAEFTSLRQAAKSMKMNASTLVRHMERLETNLGTSIFDRMPQGFVLNEAGRSVVEVARDMQKQFFRLRDVASQDQTARGRVKVAITEGLGTFWMAPKLPQFAEENPEILIEMESTMELRNPIKNEADIAIQFRKPENPDLIVSKLCNMHLYPFASLKYLEKFGIPSLDAKMPRHRLILQEAEQFAENAVGEVLKKSRIEVDTSFVTNSSIAHLYAIERGLGIGALPTFSMAMGARLIPIDVNIQHTVDVWISYRRDMRKLKRVAIVIDWLRQIFSPQRYPWFSPVFKHPAEVMEIVNQTMDRQDIFDSRIIKNFIESKDNLPANNFKRPVGRPRLERR